MESENPLKEIYQDVAHPAASEIGKTLALPFRAVNVLLTPVAKWVMQGEAKLDEISHLVAEEVKHIPEEKLVSPEPYVAVPAMQAITYSLDCDELKRMYAKLLAKAMNADEKDHVHPAYVEIIKQMSPLDAVSLKFIQQGGRSAIAMCNIRWQKKSREAWTGFKLIRLEQYGSFLYRHLVKAFEEGYSEKDITVSFENLDRLGLIVIHDDMQLERDNYKDFESHPFVLSCIASSKDFPSPDKNEVALLPAAAQITMLGETFSAICLDIGSHKVE